MSTMHTASGRFYTHFRAIERAGRVSTTPILLSEGDSWFSMPLYTNLMDWITAGTKETAILRMERSGDLAAEIFAGRSLRNIERRLREIPFDALLLSGGGNDFVGEFLRAVFNNCGRMSVSEAVSRVVESRRFDEVRNAYQKVIDASVEIRPSMPIIAHSYDYPLLMSEPARLSIDQIGLVALLKRRVGDWIARYVEKALPEISQQREFARELIDQFHNRVLVKLQAQNSNNFSFVDFRGTLSKDNEWNDEMHPSSEGFRRLAIPYRVALRNVLPPDKRGALG